MAKFLVGRSMSSVKPDPNAPVVGTPGYQDIEFVPPGYDPTTDGVSIKLAAQVAPTDIRPVATHVYVLPPADLPTGDALTPEFFQSSAYPHEDQAIPDDGTDAAVTVVVPGVPFGPLAVQLVNEYPDPVPPA